MKRFLATVAAALVATTALAEYRAPGTMNSPTVNRGPSAAQKQLPVLRVCTGRDIQSIYYAAAGQIAKFGTGSFVIQPVLTQGSLENIQKVTEGTCDAAIAQSDAIRVYRDTDVRAETNVERITAMYKEFAHLLCNRKAGISKVSDLKKGHVVAIGSDGSGSNVTWQGFVKARKDKYGVITTSPKEGIRAIAAVADGAETTCALIVGGLNNSLLKKEAQRYGDKVVLINVQDGDFGSEKDAKGSPIYSYEAIPAKTYGDLMPAGMIFGHNDAHTVAVDAVFIANTTFLDRNPGLSDALIRAATNALPAIKEKVTQ